MPLLFKNRPVAFGESFDIERSSFNPPLKYDGTVIEYVQECNVIYSGDHLSLNGALVPVDPAVEYLIDRQDSCKNGDLVLLSRLNYYSFLDLPVQQPELLNAPLASAEDQATLILFLEGERMPQFLSSFTVLFGTGKGDICCRSLHGHEQLNPVHKANRHRLQRPRSRN